MLEPGARGQGPEPNLLQGGACLGFTSPWPLTPGPCIGGGVR